MSKYSALHLTLERKLMAIASMVAAEKHAPFTKYKKQKYIKTTTKNSCANNIIFLPCHQRGVTEKITNKQQIT